LKKKKEAEATPAPGVDAGFWLPALAGLAAAVMVRLVFLDADPPWDFTWSQALFTDGARALNGARSKIVFGTWIPDARSPVLLFYPVVNLFAYVVFRLGGVGLAQANLAGALPGIASIAFLFFWMKRYATRRAALMALFALGLAYTFVVYSRTPMVEAFQILMLVLAFAALMKHTAGGLLLAGLLAGVSAFMIKMHSLHFVPVALVYLRLGYVPGRDGEASRKKLAGMLLAGFAAAAGFYLATVYPANPEIVGKYFRSNILVAQRSDYSDVSFLGALQKRLGALLHIGSGRDGFFRGIPVLAGLAYAGLLSVLSGWSGRKPASRPWERLALVWLIGLASALSLLGYRPLRYQVLMILPVALLASAFVSRLGEGRPLLAARKPPRFSLWFALWFVWVGIHVQQDVIYSVLSGGGALIGGSLTASQVSMYRYMQNAGVHLLVYGGVAAAVVLLAGKYLASARLRLPQRTSRAVFFVLLIAVAALNLGKFAGYAADRRYSIVEVGAALREILPEGVFMVGDCSTTLALETGFRSLPAYGDLIRYDEKEAFEAYPVTHFLIRFPTLFEYLNENYPDFQREARAVRRFVLCGREATVVRYEAWPGFPGTYRASPYETAAELLATGQPGGAEALLEAEISGSGGSPRMQSLLAVARSQAGDAAGAEAAIARAVELAPRDALSREIYGDILSSLGRHAEARTQWERALELNPASRSLRAKLGGRSR
jgi:tetratricopeptide (TPR) repeat protein